MLCTFDGSHRTKDEKAVGRDTESCSNVRMIGWARRKCLLRWHQGSQAVGSLDKSSRRQLRFMLEDADCGKRSTNSSIMILFFDLGELNTGAIGMKAPNGQGYISQ